MDYSNVFYDDSETFYIDLAYNKCITNINESEFDTPGYCPRTFDGWSCWNKTPAGQVSYGPCPYFIVGFDSRRMAHKTCMSDAQWFRHPETNTSWSNYTSCVDTEDLALRQRVNYIYIVGYSISLVALVISIAVFFFFKSLRDCTRITIHKNLFMSFIINNTAWIIWYTSVIKQEVVQRNPIECQILHILIQYFLVCNYFWMFCEGLYLHTLLVVAFVNDHSLVKWFYFLGWVVPLFLTCIYASIRSFFPKETTLCWSGYNSNFTLILSAPILASMVANLVFLINIVVVLVTKLRAVNSHDVNEKRKAVRATLILIPLLGLHYLVMPFRPSTDSVGAEYYEIISAIFTSCQGLCVACLFCFFNGEVISLVTRKWNQKRALSAGTYSMACNTTVSRFNSCTKRSKNCQPETSRTNKLKLEDIIPRWW